MAVAADRKFSMFIDGDSADSSDGGTTAVINPATEEVIAQVPAVVNQITVRHHLTALGVKWLGFRRLGDEEVPDFILQQMLGIQEPDWKNILMVVATAAIALAASMRIICNREYLTADEDRDLAVGRASS